MKKYLLSLLMISIQMLSYAEQKEYTISGYVKDSLTREPLIGVTIITDDYKGTTTNTYGFYSFNTTKKDVNLTFSYLGYQNLYKELDLNSDISLDVLLSESFMSLDGAVVLSDLPALARVKAYGSVAINSEQLKYLPSFLGEQDMFKYFQLLPGVIPGKEGSSGMNIRGGSSDQTLIMMDDIPIYNHSHAFGFVSIFSGDFIKSAELFKGYVPPNYGGRLSGVATMNMREGNRNEHKQMLQVGLITVSALLEGPINKGKGSYIVGGRYFVPDLILRAYNLSVTGDELKSTIGFFDITAKVSYDLGAKNTIYANFYTGRDAMSFTSDYSDIDETTKEESKVNTVSGLNWGNIVGSIRLSSQLSNKLFLNTTAYYSLLSNEKNSEYNDFIDNNKVHSTIESRMSELGVKMLFGQNINSWYNLSYGLNFSYQNFTPQNLRYDRNGIISNIDYGERGMLSGTLFLNNKFTLNKFEINLGGRASLFNNNKENVIALEPRISVNYTMPKSSLWISYVQNVQPLFSMNQYYNSMPIDYWVPFQNAKELPRSSQLALGYKYNLDFGLEILAEGYMKKSKNISLIYNIDDYLLDDGGYELVTGHAYGAELMLQYIKGRLNLMGSYTYSKSTHDIKGEKVDFIFDTPHNLNLVGSYETFRKGDKTHTLSININYKTGLPYIIANEAYPMDDPFVDGSYEDDLYNNIHNNPLYANIRLTDFFRVDLNYSMEKKLRKGSRIWQISILNATAHKNPYLIYSDSRGKYKGLALIPFPLPSFSYKRTF